MLVLPVCSLGIILGLMLLRMLAVKVVVWRSAKMAQFSHRIAPEASKFTNICRRELHIARYSSHPSASKVIPFWSPASWLWIQAVGLSEQLIQQPLLKRWRRKQTSVIERQLN